MRVFGDRQCSVCFRCPVPGDHPSQAAFRWVSTWMGDCLLWKEKRFLGYFMFNFFLLLGYNLFGIINVFTILHMVFFFF